MAGTGTTDGLTQRWDDVGSHGSVDLGAVQLWVAELPLVEPVVTAGTVHGHRPVVFVQVTGQTKGEVVEGWGECAALGDATYDREDVSVSFRVLEETLVPALFEMAGESARLPRPTALGGVRQAAPDAPLAFAALEMAVADVHLRAEHRSLAAVLGVEHASVELGAVVGMYPTTAALVARVRELADAGFSRVKMKIGPGSDLDPVDAVSRALPGLRLQVDANGSYAEMDADHLLGLDRFDLLCIEQPFARADLAAHARLADRISTPVCLDESVGSRADVETALALGACSVICVKPARLGGLGPALEVIAGCGASGVPLWMGGMFETSYARGVNTTVAALPGFAWPGDLSPATTYLREDVGSGLRLSRTGPARSLSASPPQGAGMGPPPDHEDLIRRAVRHRAMAAPRR
ncbi:MAG TPA: o-succinylbenzoate synthase [Acidimicrobiales bacterium]|nr:o-succinylbenzoate synthase [Acidimicrobiales bacterium]